MKILVTGRAKICDGYWVAPLWCIRNAIVVGDQTLVRMSAVVT